MTNFLTFGEVFIAGFIDELPFIERKKAMRRWLRRLKARLICKCGKPVTEFHHYTGCKTMKINAMVRKACTMEQLIDELILTVPLCHDCHVEETKRMRNGNNT